MGPRRSLGAVAARAAAIGLLALCSAGAAAAQRGREDATAPAAGVRLGAEEGRVSAPARLFAEQAFLERQDQKPLRQQDSLWARHAGTGRPLPDAPREGEPAAAVFEAFPEAAATRSRAFESSKGMVEAGEKVDLQEERRAGGGDGAAAAVAGIAASVLAALATLTMGAVGSTAPESRPNVTETALFAPDDAVSEELQAPRGGVARRARRLRGASPAAGAAGGSSAARSVGVGGDAARGGAEAGADAAGGGHVHRVLQVTCRGVSFFVRGACGGGVEARRACCGLSFQQRHSVLFVST